MVYKMQIIISKHSLMRNNCTKKKCEGGGGERESPRERERGPERRTHMHREKQSRYSYPPKSGTCIFAAAFLLCPRLYCCSL